MMILDGGRADEEVRTACMGSAMPHLCTSWIMKQSKAYPNKTYLFYRIRQSCMVNGDG
jgi:hypothetical protein